MDDIYQKWKKNLKHTNYKNIQSIYRNGIWDEIGAIQTKGKRKGMQGIELKNQENITLKVKETYKYSGILEADTMKQRDEILSKKRVL